MLTPPGGGTLSSSRDRGSQEAPGPGGDPGRGGPCPPGRDMGGLTFRGACPRGPPLLGSFPKFEMNGRGSPSGADLLRGGPSPLPEGVFPLSPDELPLLLLFEGPLLFDEDSLLLFLEPEVLLLLSSFSWDFLANIGNRPIPFRANDDTPLSDNRSKRAR